MLAGWGAIGWAQSTTNNQTTRIIIYPGVEGFDRPVEKTGCRRKVGDYGSYWLAQPTDSQLKSLKKTMGERLQEANHLNRIELNDSVIDDVTKGEPAVTENLREFTAPQKLLRIVQFKGPIVPAHLPAINSVPARMSRKHQLRPEQCPI